MSDCSTAQTTLAWLKDDRAHGELEKKCRARILRNHREFPKKGYRFDAAAGLKAIGFVEGWCTHYQGEWAGKPMLLEGWQKAITMEVFAWKNPDGFRVVRTMWIEIARKNGKSQWAAAIAMLLLVADNEPGAQVYSSATKRDQAKIVFEAAAMMVKQSARLRKWVKPHKFNMSVARTGSKFVPLSAEGDTLDGLNPHGNIVDEIHAHKNRLVWDVLLTAQGARRQPLNVVITTAGIYNPEAIGWQLHDYAEKILERTFEDDSWFVWISAADKDDDPFARTTWEKANPNIGVSVYPAYLKDMAQKARDQPSFMNTFLRLHCNIWTQQADRWLQMHHWEACGEREVNEAELIGLDCFGGLDLSEKLDMTALVLAFERDGFWDLLCRFWAPEDTMVIRERRDRIPYSQWVREGWVSATPGNVIDYEFILAEITVLAARHNIVELAYDPWSALQMSLKLDEEGMLTTPMRQGFASLSEPSKEFEALVVSGRIGHGHNPVLRWMANNVTVRHDPAGNIKPDKEKSTQKIDGIVAAIMAVGRGTLTLNASSVYETQGMDFI